MRERERESERVRERYAEVEAEDAIKRRKSFGSRPIVSKFNYRRTTTSLRPLLPSCGQFSPAPAPQTTATFYPPVTTNDYQYKVSKEY